MAEWHLPNPVDISASFQDAIGGHLLVSTILHHRGYADIDIAHAFLDPDHYAPSSPTDIPDVDIAAERLWRAIQKQETILVWGDFDVDGQTSTSLLVNALSGLGAKVKYHVPHRIKHGHGVQVPVLRKFFGEVDVILTCDTGVAAHEAVEAAHVAGIDILITDHHALPPKLPNAVAVVNPQRLSKDHALRDLPGVGVAYKLIQHLYELADRAGEEKLLLDLVALGIVCDVATQQRDTRYLLQLGIDELRHPKRTGIQALLHSAQVDVSNLSSDTIGFQIGPRLNALGRLDDARHSVELLTTSDMTRARGIAAQLEILNQKRRQIEDQIYAAAQEQIAKEPSLLHFDALVLENPHWHPGVIGIVASRLVEQYGKPTVLIATPEDRQAGGSARSIPGVDIGACIASTADILIGHGGHPGAAGVRIEADLIPQFRRRLSNRVKDTRDPNVSAGHEVDAEVAFGSLSMDLADELNRLAPFGAGNPPIHLVTRNLRPVSHSLFGVNKKHRRVVVEDDAGVQYPVTWWRGADYHMPDHQIDLLYIPRINDYKGRRSLQLEWVDAKAVPGIDVQTGPRYTFVDMRQDSASIGDVLSEETAIWAEGIAPDDLPYDQSHVITRYDIKPVRTLLIWTAPPGPAEVQQILDQTNARTIHVLAGHIPDDSPGYFLRRLAGLVKYAISHYDGKVTVTRLASAMAQKEVTLRRGLDFMQARGQITIEWLEGDALRLSNGGTPDEEQIEPLQDSINALLSEASAFRCYFQQADLEHFFK